VLREHLNEFIMVYLNDIIIYLMSEKEHKEHIKWVLKRLYVRAGRGFREDSKE